MLLTWVTVAARRWRSSYTSPSLKGSMSKVRRFYALSSLYFSISGGLGELLAHSNASKGSARMPEIFDVNMRCDRLGKGNR